MGTETGDGDEIQEWIESLFATQPDDGEFQTGIEDTMIQDPPRTVPLCWVCWDKEQPNRTPHRITDKHIETCARCGSQTQSGIYVRT